MQDNNSVPAQAQENKEKEVISSEKVSKCNSHGKHTGQDEKETDELLQTIWELEEEGLVSLTHFQSSGQGQVILKNLTELTEKNLVSVQDGHIRFTATGEERARNVIRRHRLAERMLVDLFEISKSSIEEPSCEMEHILSKEVTDSICSFLGHPTACPHGRPIPPGECCEKLQTVIRPLVMPLSELAPSESGKISFISSMNKHRLQRLSSLGIIPGSVITLRQKLPTFVIRIGETEVALDASLVSEIYVRRIKDN